jgi:hypothetical protein
MDPANYSMRLRQQGGTWHVSVTRSVRGGRGSASLYYDTRDSQSETRTFTTAKRPLSAKGAWNAADRAAAARRQAHAGAALRAGLIAVYKSRRCEQCGAAAGTNCLRSVSAESGPDSLLRLDKYALAVVHVGRVAAAIDAGQVRRSQVLAQFGTATPPVELAGPVTRGLVGWLRRRAARMYDVRPAPTFSKLRITSPDLTRNGTITLQPQPRDQPVRADRRHLAILTPTPDSHFETDGDPDGHDPPHGDV